jgi:glycosyltransferase involved in cell wall biosynthesis
MYAASQIFVFPSLHEAFGIAPLEALAAGCPVISTNVGGPVEVLNDRVAVFQNPLNQQAWLDNIKHLLEDTELRRQISLAGKDFAKKFSWSKVASKIIEVYNNENLRAK